MMMMKASRALGGKESIKMRAYNAAGPPPSRRVHRCVIRTPFECPSCRGGVGVVGISA